MSAKDNSSAEVSAPLPSNKQLLLQLAERCEREEASLDLNCAIALATGWTCDTGCALPWLPPTGVRRRPMPFYFTTSIDAAVTLVPEGAYWRVDGAGAACVYTGGARTMAEHIGQTNAAATAICAAALRARAAMATDDSQPALKGEGA